MLNEFARDIHEQNKRWWCDLDTGEYRPLKRCQATLFALIHSELSEMLEAVRKDLQSEKLPGVSGEAEELADVMIRVFDFCGGLGIDFRDGYQQTSLLSIGHVLSENGRVRTKAAWVNRMHDVLSLVSLGKIEEFDCVVMECCEYAYAHGIDIDRVIAMKLEYNKTRIDHTNEHRKAENGKKF